MKLNHVSVVCNVTAKVFTPPFRYRVYINDELFTERTWIWQNVYLEEMLQISAPAGTYTIRFEIVDPDNGRLKVRKHRTHIDLLRDNIEQFKNELVQFMHSNVQPYGRSDLAYFYDPTRSDQDIIQDMTQHIEQEGKRLELYVQTRPARIITHNGETAVEISDAST